MGPNVESSMFMDRLDWNGTKRGSDIQDASIYLLNVTFNDSGTYQCFFYRTLYYENYENISHISKVVRLTVVAKGMKTYRNVKRCPRGTMSTVSHTGVFSACVCAATRGTASIVSEVMMYVSIIGLQLWLLIEMIYCYRKIAAAGEEALREAA